MKTSRNNLIIFHLVALVFILAGYLLLSQNKTGNNIDIKCPDSIEKYNCWRQALTETLENQGLGSAFEVLANLYETEPDFVSECHGFTHELGEKSYKLYSKNKSIEVTPKASYCGYGFYHGFVETLLHSGAPLKEAEDFCIYADQQLFAYGPKTSIACYHGIGHGAVDGSDPRHLGDPQKLIQPGLDICRTISAKDTQINQCGTGVFNALAIAFNANLYNLRPSETDPYEICLTQDKDFIGACYEQMNTRAVQLSKDNFDVAAKFVTRILNKEHAIIAMNSLAPAIIANDVGQSKSYKAETDTCRSMPQFLRKPCIEGLAGGILEFGKPDYEYVEAIDFCESLHPNETDQKICYSYVASNVTMVYSPEKAKQVCNMIDLKYEPNCN